MIEVGAMLAGHFVGSHGPHLQHYVKKDRGSAHPLLLDEAADDLAMDLAAYDPEVVVGPELGAIKFAFQVALRLSRILGREVISLDAEKERILLTKDHKLTFRDALLDREMVVDWPLFVDGQEQKLVIETGKMRIKRNADLIAGRRTAVIDDILTTGGSLKETCDAALEAGGILVCCGLLWNRSGKDAPVPVPVESWIEEALPSLTWEECKRQGPCSRGEPINTELGRGAEFVAKYGQPPYK